MTVTQGSSATVWPNSRLGDTCKLLNGDPYKPRDWSKSGTPIIRIQNLNDPTKPYNYWAGPLSDRILVKRGDLLLAWSGTPGTSFGAHIWNGDLAVLNQHIFRIDITTAGVTPQWMQLAINYQLDVLVGHAQGAVGLRHVTRDEVENLRIPLPPIEKQRLIIQQLEQQMAPLRQLQLLRSEQLSFAKTLPAKILREEFDGVAKSGAPLRRISEVCSFLPARSLSNLGDADVKIATTACLTETGFNISGVRPGRMHRDDATQCLLRPGEVLIARSNTEDFVGRASVFEGEQSGVVAGDLTIRLLPDSSSLLPSFLGQYLSQLFLSGYWRTCASGASGSMKKITRSQLSALTVPVPDLRIQRRLSERAVEQIKVAVVSFDRILSIIKSIELLRSALLRGALSGQF